MTRPELSLPVQAGKRQLALTLAGSVFFLLVAAALWYGAGLQAAHECLDTNYGIPQANATGMTGDGCRVAVAGQWSDELPSRGDNAVLAVIAAALAAVPPYVLALRQRHRS